MFTATCSGRRESSRFTVGAPKAGTAGMSGHCCKVGAAVDEYDLPASGANEDVDEYLIARWIGEDDWPAVGYRTLTDWFNERVLRTVYLRHDRSVTDARIESEYAALTGDDDLRRREVLDDLRADGIDADRLREALVSRSTMARHLKRCLGAEKERRDGGGESGNWECDKVAHGRRVLRRSASESVSSLANKGLLPEGDEAEIEIQVLLACPECATRVTFETAFERGYVCADHTGGRPETTPANGS